MSSNGNYVDVASNLYCPRQAQYKVAGDDTLLCPIVMAIATTLPFASSEYNYVTSSTISYAPSSMARASVASRKIITDGTEKPDRTLAQN